MWEILYGLRWRDVLDILLLAVVLYWILLTFKGTRATQMLVGVLLLGGATVAARHYELFGTSWILENFWAYWVLALIVLFQPELRRVLARVGHSRLLQGVLGAGHRERGAVVDDVVQAADSLAAKRIGALMVLERSTGLRQYAELGVPLDALVSSDLLESLFHPYSPLHDGAIVIQGNRVVAAGCFLPLSRNPEVGRELGTRHRAALGLSEETDAAVLVVSEETGRVSLAVEGQMESPLDRGELRRRLAGLLAGGGVSPRASFLDALMRRWATERKAERHGRA